MECGLMGRHLLLAQGIVGSNPITPIDGERNGKEERKISTGVADRK